MYTLFEQIASLLNAPIRQAHDRPLTEAAYIDTIPPISCRAGGYQLDGKIEVGVRWPAGTRDTPHKRKYSATRSAEVLAKAIQRDILDAHAARYREEVSSLAGEEDTENRREMLAQELAELSGYDKARNDKFTLPGRSGSAEVGLGADSVYFTLYGVSVETAKKIIAALKEV